MGDGVKTGHTTNAGYVLVGSAKGRGGAEVISVVLGEPSEPARDADTLELLTWGLKQFHRVRVLDPQAAARPRRHPLLRGRAGRLVPRRGAVVTIRRGERVAAPGQVARRARGTAAGRLALPGAVTVLVEGERCGAWRWSRRPRCLKRGR